MRKSNNRKRVHRLWDISKKCFWCGKETVLQESGLGVAQPNTATYDHLYHRTEPQRKLKQFKDLGVLACYACNQKRGRDAYIKTLPFWNRYLIYLRLNTYVYRIKKKFLQFYRRLR